MLTREQISALRKPFKPEQIKHKIQVNPKNAKQEEGKEVGWGTVVFYLDSRDVAERLDLAINGDWADEYSLFGSHLECTLTVCGVARRDVGEGKNPKELYSDAFKRSAVKFGVGAFLYRLPNVLCKMENVSKVRDKPRWELTKRAIQSLRRMKELAQGEEAWPERFDNVMMISDFQASEDFSEPEKEEEDPITKEHMEEIRVEANRIYKERVQAEIDAKGQDTKRSSWLPGEGVIVGSPVSVERDTLLPEGEPESPEHIPPASPPVPALVEPSEFMPLISSAKKALGIPVEQKPVKASEGDGPITQDERKKLMAVLSSFDVKKKEPVMSCLSFLLKRPLESSNEISTAEARSLINGLSLTDVEAWRESERREE